MIKIRIIKKSDWKSIFALWQNTPGMGLNSLDDSEKGIKQFLARNRKTCFLAEENHKVV
jgi:N-acetylglutamate synthase